MINAIILVLTALFLLYKVLTSNYQYWAKRNVPFIKPIPLFGNFFPVSSFKECAGPYLKTLYDSCAEPFFGIFIFSLPHLIIKDPVLVKTILIKDFNKFTDRLVHNGPSDPVTAEMLFFSKNPFWKQIRSKLTPVFTSGKLRNMFGLMESASKDMNNYLGKLVKTEKTLETKEVCSKYSTDVIAICAFAINANSFKDEKAQFRQVGREVFEFTWSNAIQQSAYFFAPKLVDIFKMKFVKPSSMQFLEEVFWSAIKQREATNSQGNDLIDVLVDIRKDTKFSKANQFEGAKVVAQAAQFFFAGFETTSSTMAFLLYELCLHPEMQDKVREEIKAEMKDKKISYDGIQNMKYFDMCFSETLRKYPVLPFLDRVCNEEYQIPNSNVTLEAGTRVLIPMFGLHYDEKYFPNPDEFIPERFADKNEINQKGYSYIPFGEGPRNCIGARFGLLAAKLGVLQILSEYRVARAKETPVPIVYETKTFLLMSKVGLPMNFIKSPIF